MTTVVVGPICGRTLGDQGADVIKIEAPGETFCAPWLRVPEIPECRESS